VRYGCTKDWRVDYVSFELTRAPEYTLRAADYELPDKDLADGAGDDVAPEPKQKPRVTRVHLFNRRDDVVRQPIVVIDRRQPTQLLAPMTERLCFLIDYGFFFIYRLMY
jgi:hypothetical protein